MTTFKGWKRIEVTLDTGSVRVCDIEDPVIQRGLGGRGLNSLLLQERLSANTQPLSAGNILCIAPGLLVSRFLVGGCVTFASSLSPLTGILGNAKITGKFGAAMRDSGATQLILSGSATRPVYVLLRNGHAGVQTAEGLWGLPISETVKKLKGLHPHSSILCIGPAGERAIPYASILTDDFRALARCGLGAVMGSKKVKAVVVEQTRGVRQTEYEGEFKKACLAIRRRIVEAIGERRSPYMKWIDRGGSGGFLGELHAVGRLPVRNWTGTQLKGIEALYPSEFPKYATGRKGCLVCPLLCFHNVEFRHGGKLIRGEGIHTEFMANMGLLLGITELGWILRLCYVANELGLDIIEAANAIALAIECNLAGILPKELQDKDLRWNNPEKVEQLLADIVNRRGLGAILAPGTTRAAESIGEEAKKKIVATKGMAWNAIEPRVMKLAALSNITSARGGDCSRDLGRFALTCKDPHHLSGKAELVWQQENETALLDLLGVCKNVFRYEPECLNREDITHLTSLVLHKNVSYEWLLERGAHMARLEQQLNANLGTKYESVLPSRLLQPVADGPFKGQCIEPDEFERELGRYRILRQTDGASQQ